MSISLCLSSFWGSFDLFFHLGHISLSWCTCYIVRAGALSICRSGVTHFNALWHCLWGRGQRGNNVACSAFASHSVTSPATHKQTGPFWCLLPGGWASVHSQIPWAPPMDSPVRLAVTATTVTSTGFYIQRFEALLSHAGTLGSMVFLAPQFFLPVYMHMNVGTPSPPASTLHVLATLATCLCPSCKFGWMFLL